MMFSEGDVYDKLTARLGYARSKNLRRIFELACTREQAELLAELPAPSDEIAKKLNRAKQTLDEQIEDLLKKGMVHMGFSPEGERRYSMISAPEPLCDHMIQVIGAHDFDERTRAIGGETNREIADLWKKFNEEEWYRWQRPDELVHRRIELAGRLPGLTFTVHPAWKALEKSGCDIPAPFWDARQVARDAKRIIVQTCECRVRERNCDLPVWTCTTFETTDVPSTHAQETDIRGTGRDFSAEQWLEQMGRCEELGMVHIGFPPLAPFVCTCDTCCCNVFVPLIRYAKPSEGLDKAPFRAVVSREICEGCPECVEYCRFEAINIKTDSSSGKRKAFVDVEKCFGCGQCVVHCPVERALRLEVVNKVVA